MSQGLSKILREMKKRLNQNITKFNLNMNSQSPSKHLSTKKIKDNLIRNRTYCSIEKYRLLMIKSLQTSNGKIANLPTKSSKIKTSKPMDFWRQRLDRVISPSSQNSHRKSTKSKQTWWARQPQTTPHATSRHSQRRGTMMPFLKNPLASIQTSTLKNRWPSISSRATHRLWQTNETPLHLGLRSDQGSKTCCQTGWSQLTMTRRTVVGSTRPWTRSRRRQAICSTVSTSALKT